MKTIKNRFTNISLYKKILIVVFTALLCSYTVFFSNLKFLTDQYENELYQTNAMALNHVSDAVTAEMQAIETISANIMIDPAIQENLRLLIDQPATYESSQAKKELYSALYPHAFYNGYVTSINIVLHDKTNICMGSTASMESFDQRALEEQSKEAMGRMIWMPQSDSGDDIVGARQIRELKYLKLEDLASLYIVVDLERLVSDSLKKAGYSPATSNFILFAEGARICPATPGYEDSLYEAVFRHLQASGYHYMVSTVNQEKEFIISGSIPYTGWNYLYIRDYNPIFYNIASVKLQVFSVSVLCIILVFLLVRLIVAHILKHLDFLIQKIECFGHGEPVPPDLGNYNYETRQDEIGQLHRSFDQMTVRVKVLRDENYDKQLLLRDATIKMLQQQINPHFLYNTLDTINCMALRYGADDISTMVRSLANLFRSSVAGQDDVILLADELEVLENYVRIQKIRFRDRLDFTMEIPEDISHIFVPKLCIQPLVENALKHALEDTVEMCTITVSVREYDHDYRITVANTGSRFEEDLLWKIEHRQITPHGSGVGLTNIDSRMKLLYGDRYGLNFYNTDGMAVVMLKIPKERTNQDAEIDDN